MDGNTSYHLWPPKVHRSRKLLLEEPGSLHCEVAGETSCDAGILYRQLIGIPAAVCQCTWEKQRKTTEVLPMMWEAQMKFLAPGFCLSPRHLGIKGGVKEVRLFSLSL